MSLIQKLAELPSVKQFDFLLEHASDCRKTQESVLLDILRNCENTRVGKRYDFSSIHSIEDFQIRVPICDWDDMQNDVQDMEEGQQDILFPGRPIIFIVSSGTSGMPKHIPESEPGSQAKAVVSSLRSAVLFKSVDLTCPSSAFLPFSNSSEFSKTKSNVPIGSASGLTLSNASPEIKQKVAFPVEVLQLFDQRTIDYLIMRFSLMRDIQAIVGNNPVRFAEFFAKINADRQMLIEDIALGRISPSINLDSNFRVQWTELLGGPNEVRAKQLESFIEARGELSPVDYWPNLKIVSCWLSGSVGSHRHRLDKWLDSKTMFFDCGYGASEGKFNIPIEPNHPAGILASISYFFEFQSLEDDSILLAHQLKDQCSYKLIVTSYSGLYRYNMKDIVKVHGFVGNTPKIYFESKTKDFINITGEKISGTNVINLVRSSLESKGIKLKHVAIRANQEVSHYDLLIEIESGSLPDKDWLESFDKQLMDKEIAYKVFRGQNLIQMVQLVLMKEGWQEGLLELHAPKNKGKNQIKLPVVYEHIPLESMEISRIKSDTN